MSTTATASDVQNDFATYQSKALTEPVRVTEHGRETVYIVAAETFRAMKQAHRTALASADLTAEEICLVETAEIPLEHRYTLTE